MNIVKYRLQPKQITKAILKTTKCRFTGNENSLVKLKLAKDETLLQEHTGFFEEMLHIEYFASTLVQSSVIYINGSRPLVRVNFLPVRRIPFFHKSFQYVC